MFSSLLQEFKKPWTPRSYGNILFSGGYRGHNHRQCFHPLWAWERSLLRNMSKVTSRKVLEHFGHVWKLRGSPGSLEVTATHNPRKAAPSLC